MEMLGLFSSTYISCPADARKTLGIKLRHFGLIVKNMKKYLTFEVEVSRRIRFEHLCDYNYYRFSTIKARIDVFERVITKVRRALSRTYAQCHLDSTMVGIR